MLSLSRKSDYALIALAGLARCGPDGASSRELAEWYHMPLPLLRNVLKLLAQAGLVESTRGSTGGYRLGRPAGRISLADLVEAIEGQWQLASCCSSEEAPEATVDEQADEHVCGLESTCPVTGPVRKLHVGLRSFLDQITLEHILTDRLPATIRMNAPSEPLIGATVGGGRPTTNGGTNGAAGNRAAATKGTNT